MSRPAAPPGRSLGPRRVAPWLAGGPKPAMPEPSEIQDREQARPNAYPSRTVPSTPPGSQLPPSTRLSAFTSGSA